MVFCISFSRKCNLLMTDWVVDNLKYNPLGKIFSTSNMKSMLLVLRFITYFNNEANSDSFQPVLKNFSVDLYSHKMRTNVTTTNIVKANYGMLSDILEIVLTF